MNDSMNSTVDVLLTDRDNSTYLVRCPDIDTAERVAAAAVFSDGGVSAWLVPDEPGHVVGPTITDLRRITEPLQDGLDLVELASLLSSETEPGEDWWDFSEETLRQQYVLSHNSWLDMSRDPRAAESAANAYAEMLHCVRILDSRWMEDNQGPEDSDLGDHSATQIAGAGVITPRVRCGCGFEFAAFKHPVEDEYDSPDWASHAARHRTPGQRP
jgi:hypothetical protein